MCTDNRLCSIDVSVAYYTTISVTISVFIAPSGTNTAGETYSLVCSVTVTGSANTPAITWLNGDIEITSDSSRTVSSTTSDGTNGYSSTLTFNPLSASHAGTYTCIAAVSGEEQSDMQVVTVQSE